MTPNWPLLPVQTGSQSWIRRNISQRQCKLRKFNMVCIVQIDCIFTKKWPQFDLYFLSKPEVKVYLYYKKHISTTARGKFTICALLYRSLILKKNIYKKVTPIWPLLPVQTGSQSLILKNHISTTARGKFTIFAPLYRSLIVKKYLQKSDPIDLYFLSKPEVKV